MTISTVTPAKERFDISEIKSGRLEVAIESTKVVSKKRNLVTLYRTKKVVDVLSVSEKWD